MPSTNQSPGTMLKVMLNKYQLNCNRLAKEIGCSQTALRLISLDKSRITTSVALRLAKFFNTNPEYWLVAQMKYDISASAKDKNLAKALKGISSASKVSLGRNTTARAKTTSTGTRKTKKK